MPYKSDKQRKYFHAAEKRGDIDKKVVDEFDKASKGKSIPDAADGSHEKSHKMVKGSRGAIHEGSPGENARYKHGAKE